MSKAFTPLYKNLGYRFKNIRLLKQALTHCSAHAENNERLEFLGDAILDLIIAEYLYNYSPQTQEGKMSQYRAAVVNANALASLARKLDIGHYLMLSPGESKSGGSQRISILSGAMEAVIGAIYIDAGIEATRDLVLSWMKEKIEKVRACDTEGKSPKSRLQEYLQARKLTRPTYNLVQATGKAHEQTFLVECSVPHLDIKTAGEGSSRRKAEQAAADAFLTKLFAIEN